MTTATTMTRNRNSKEKSSNSSGSSNDSKPAFHSCQQQPEKDDDDDDDSIQGMRTSIVNNSVNININGYGCSCIDYLYNVIAWLVWPLLLTVPLLLSSPYSCTSYASIFPLSWYEYDYYYNNDDSINNIPKPLGLCLGILAVAIGQVWVWLFFYLYKYGYLMSSSSLSSSISSSHIVADPPPQHEQHQRPAPAAAAAAAASEPRSIQQVGARPYRFTEGLMTHISQPEGFVVLILYLSTTWMLRIMPASYYSFHGSIQYDKVAASLICQEFIQFVMHYLEHTGFGPTFYQYSHKPHHRFTNPRLFDAFNGSLPDTICMIILPLACTAQIVRTCNVWTYMAFGSTYASWLTLIHSEYVLPWDVVFRKLGLGTPADHHVHHKFFVYNYGHLLTWFDRLAGTYRDPNDASCSRVFRENV
jgi:alternative squalene epoxidase